MRSPGPHGHQPATSGPGLCGTGRDVCSVLTGASTVCHGNHVLLSPGSTRLPPHPRHASFGLCRCKVCTRVTRSRPSFLLRATATPGLGTSPLLGAQAGPGLPHSGVGGLSGWRSRHPTRRSPPRSLSTARTEVSSRLRQQRVPLTRYPSILLPLLSCRKDPKGNLDL